MFLFLYYGDFIPVIIFRGQYSAAAASGPHPLLAGKIEREYFGMRQNVLPPISLGQQ